MAYYDNKLGKTLQIKLYSNFVSNYLMDYWHKPGIHLIALITSHTVKQYCRAGVLITFSDISSLNPVTFHNFTQLQPRLPLFLPMLHWIAWVTSQDLAWRGRYPKKWTIQRSLSCCTMMSSLWRHRFVLLHIFVWLRFLWLYVSMFFVSFLCLHFPCDDHNPYEPLKFQVQVHFTFKLTFI